MPQKISLGCPLLDSRVGGGIPCKSITEIVGESGVGKTQICLQMSLNVQLPIEMGGFSSSVLYIHTNGPFPLRRLEQLQDLFHQRFSTVIHHNVVDQIFVWRIDSAYDFIEEVPRVESFLAVSSIESMPIKLIVIDSVASLFRTYFENTSRDMGRRADLMYQITRKLKDWARMFNLAVVVTNQVTDFVSSGDTLRALQAPQWEGLQTSGRRVCAALGLTWSSYINSRIFLSRDTENRRFLQTIFGMHLLETRSEYLIVRDGVFGVTT